MTNEKLVEAMDRVPMVEKWIKAVKALCKDLLNEDENALGMVYKLRGSGSTTAFTEGAVKCLEDSGHLTKEELQTLLKINEPALAKFWATKFGVTAREAKGQIRKCLSEFVVTKPKSPSIYKAKK
jgi:hypothetical protein